MTLLADVRPIAATLDRPHGLLETPRFGPAGQIVYSDVLAGGLWECAADGVVHALLPKRRGIGGAVAHADGGWVISGRTVLHMGPDGTQRELLGPDTGEWPDRESVRGFNDLGVTTAGELLAGALRFAPFAGEPARNGQLLRVRPDGEVRLLTDGLLWPSGIGLAPDGDTIYVSDYATAAVLALDADGNDVRELCRAPRGSADGLAVDEEGAVWVALGEGSGVARFDRDGRLLEVERLPVRFVSSLCFGGPDMRDVLVSTGDNQLRPELGGTLMRARSSVPGLAVSAVAV